MTTTPATDVKALELAALKGVFKDVVSEQVSYVNAPVLAEQRGINTRLITTPESEEYRNVLTIRGALSDGARAKGGPPGLADIIIAATASAHGLILLTRNRRHFEPLGVKTVNPFDGLP